MVTIKRLAIAPSLLLSFAGCSSEASQPIPRYAIPAGSLRSALDSYSRQSGKQIIYRVDDVRSIDSPGASGTDDEVLQHLLTGTGLVLRHDASGALAVVPSPARGHPSSPAAPVR